MLARRAGTALAIRKTAMATMMTSTIDAGASGQAAERAFRAERACSGSRRHRQAGRLGGTGATCVGDRRGPADRS